MPGQGEQGGVVGNIATGKYQSTFFLVQRCQFLFKFFMQHAISGNVACTASPGSVLFNSLSKENDFFFMSENGFEF